MLRILKQDDGWWIVGGPEGHGAGASPTRCGPYATKAQAQKEGMFFAEGVLEVLPVTYDEAHAQLAALLCTDDRYLKAEGGPFEEEG